MSRRLRLRRSARARAGFTLLEILIATFVFAVVMGGVMKTLTGTIGSLSRAREEVEASKLAEIRIREIEEAALSGEMPQPGRSEGTFPAPSDHMAWILEVESYALPLPPELARRKGELASVFEQRRKGGGSGPILRVELRVYPVDGDPDRVSPFLLLTVEPLS